jgi:hypothetical protein
MADSSPFPQDAMESNRAGRVADSQKQWLRAMSWDARKGGLSIAAMCAALGLVIWFAPGPPQYAVAKPLIGLALLAVALFFLLRSLSGGDAITQDLRSGKVESVEGAITKVLIRGTRSAASTHYFDVEGKRLHVTGSQYDWAPDAGIVRVFYLPHSHRAVNFERLADRPLPPGALDSPREAIKEALGAFGAHDETSRAEARAQLSAMGDQLRAKVEGSAVTGPPQGQRDPRPLSESILGTWSNGLLTFAFAPDGTATATLPGGHARSGRWSVGADGKLVADLMGQSDAAEAWVNGDELTISDRGQGIVLKRAAP